MKLFSLDSSAAPYAWIATQLLAELPEGAAFKGERALAFHFTFSQVYLPQNPVIELQALIHINIASDCSVVHLSLFPFSEKLIPAIQGLPDDLTSIREFARLNNFPMLEVSAPWELGPVLIPKPWGQEIWFTGIEARGQARVNCDGGGIPLPWVLALFPQGQGALILLKVLDPLPEKVYGDLYFELHEEKQEVYVVTCVDRDAWPSGEGVIQLGFSPEKRREYSNDIEFKNAYLNAVIDYERVRRQLDKKIDELELLSVSEPVQIRMPRKLKELINEISQPIENREIISSEEQLRQVMNSFINHLPLAVGDTVAIPRRVPHALQHGVRVVEFQTPVYERKILSFAQKVLTQNHWDTESALAIAEMDHSLITHPDVLLSNEQVKIEQIVSFDDFLVHRINLMAGNYEPELSGYSLVMPITGDLRILWGAQCRTVCMGTVMLIPESLAGCCAFAADHPCLFLLAWPKVSDKV